MGIDMPDKHDQRTFYDQNADDFDSGLIPRNNRNHRKKLRLILDAIDPGPDAKILEVGCGTGIHARLLLDEYPQIEYHGVDISDGMLAHAETRVPEGHFHNHDAQDLPYRRDSFDYVIGSGVLHHLEAQQQALREWCRVARFGVAVTEPNFLFPKDCIASLLKPEERHKINMRRWKLERWLDYLEIDGAASFRSSPPIDSHSVEPCIYTLPWPAALHDFYDRIDDYLRDVWGVREFSQMLLIHVELPGTDPEGGT